MTEKTKEKESAVTGNFSVGLGLFDYINPICYGVTVITIMIKMFGDMSAATYAVFAAGAAVSLLFGLAIPTVKLLVGLGKMQFKMPVNLVTFVNTGILLSGIALITHVMGFGPFALVPILLVYAAVVGFLWKKTGRFNTAAVLIGTMGYLLIYISLIVLAVRYGVVLLIVLYAVAICLFVFLCLVGILSDLNNAKVHWTIEISNVVCQFSVALATVILLRG